MHLESLHLYPIKSCGGLAVEAWAVERLGLCYDRRWMVVAPDGRFLSQRERPRLALVRPRLEPPHLVVEAPGAPALALPLAPPASEPARVRVWRAMVEAWWAGAEADRWFSRVLGVPCRLAYLPDSGGRPVDPAYAPGGGDTAFTDGFPFLLVGRASLDELNRRLAVPLPMNRFRPNLVVAGSEPFAEDRWRRIRIGAIAFDVVKPCARCVITTTDQDTGARGREPLRTLATFRQVGGQVHFGQNLLHRGEGRLAVGDGVEVERARD
jgi:uncharacterized protein YcbX